MAETIPTTQTNKLPRDVVQAMWRGFRCRCPACGEGRLFRSWLKVTDECPACGEPMHHHRADDFPAYLVIVIVGHIVVPMILSVETNFAPAYWIHAALWIPITLGLTLGLLQPVKGTVVALQWYLGMHGFEQAKIVRDRALSPTA